MALNKNALIRYKTIDACLRNRFRKWTLNDLIEACSDALYEYEGKDVNVSKRTVQMDIQVMRSDKLGYNAPIEVYERKFYRYAEHDYSIMNIPVTDSDLEVMNDALQVLRQFKDFSLFEEMNGVLQRLEDTVNHTKENRKPIIHLDKNEDLKGLKFLDELYQAILKKVVLLIEYKSFKARDATTFRFHPFLLKEFNNRWFLVGKTRNSKKAQIVTLALDRILSIDYDFKSEYLEENFDGDKYYKNTIGVTVSNTRPQRIQFWVDKANAPYVITKPFHNSQRLIEEREDGVIFNIYVTPNYELERLILGFGDSIEIMKPPKLRERISAKLHRASKRYHN